MTDMTGARAAQADIARRVLKTLAERKIVPTPETFTAVYEEIAGGKTARATPLAVVKDVLRDLVRTQRIGSAEAQAIAQQAQAHDWKAVRDALDKALARRPGSAAGSWPQLLLALLKQADQLHANWTRARKLEAVARVIEAAGDQPDVALDRLGRLLESWGPALAALPARDEPPPGAEPPPALPPAQRHGADPALLERLAVAEAQAAAYRQVAARAVHLLAETCGENTAAAMRLGDYARDFGTWAETDRVVPRFVDAVREFEALIDEQRRVREGLQRLLALLTENIHTLAPEETWLPGQLEPIRALLRGPLDAQRLSRAESDLTAVIARQGPARRGLAEAKVAVKELLATLIERIGSMGASTGRFYEQVGGYQKQLASAGDPAALATIIKGLLADTQIVRAELDVSRAELATARRQAEAYEARVRELQRELTQVSALVQKDPLTQALNRRGLEEAFRVETARAARYQAPLALALLDLDDFKKLNDSLGHVGGDRALIHLVQTMQATLRPTDLVARMGGEEFAVLLPATAADEARQAIERVRDELARSAFVFDGRSVTLRSSAGVAAWRAHETLEDLLRRADRALYDAKRAGKNRVEMAPE